MNGYEIQNKLCFLIFYFEYNGFEAVNIIKDNINNIFYERGHFSEGYRKSL